MKKYPIELQDEENACGAFCISMILKYYGYKDEIQNIKKNARMTQTGITMKGLIECFKIYQIEAKAYEASLQDIHTENMYPCILFMIYQDIGHFVVLYKKDKNGYLIGDPARGLISVSQEEMEDHYTLKMVGIVHVGRVPQLSYKSYLSFLKDGFYEYPGPMKKLIKKGLLIACIGYLSSYFFQIIIDDIHQKTLFFYLIVFCVFYNVMEIFKAYLERQKSEYIVNLTKAFDEDYVYTSSLSMLDYPLSFFDKDRGYIQSQIMSLFELGSMNVDCFERIFLDLSSFLIFMAGMAMIHIYMCIIVMTMIVAICTYVYFSIDKLRHYDNTYLESFLQYQNHVLELIDNHFLIKRFHLYQSSLNINRKVYQNHANAKQQLGLMMNKMQIHIQYIVYFFYMMIMIYGFYLFKKNILTLGQVMMFYMLVSYCQEPLMHMIHLASQYQYIALIYEKYKAFQIPKKTVQQLLVKKVDSVTFDHVGYSYGYQMPLFEHLDLTIRRHTFIQGKTGCGKSTLLKLLMGYDDQYTGNIYINDHLLKDIELSSLYEHIGYSDATPTFLSLSLFDNFLCEDQKRIDDYLHLFHQEELCHMMHIVLNTDGSPLSLGQRQIVALIRLLCQNYDMIVLDEAFSHMDTSLMNTVLDYLMTLDIVFIIVNHQSNTMYNNCDYVIIENGRIKSR